jgi:hypothetical protein
VPYGSTQAAQYSMVQTSNAQYDPNNACTYSNGQYYPTPALRMVWSDQVQQALTTAPTMPAPGGFVGLQAILNNNTGNSEVDLERQVDVIPLGAYAASDPALFGPLAHVRISEGELLVTQQYSTVYNSPPQYALTITAVAKPVSAGYVVRASDEASRVHCWAPGRSSIRT